MGFGKREGEGAANSRSRCSQLVASMRELGPRFARPLSQLLGCKQKNPNHKEQNITCRRNIHVPTGGMDFSPAHLLQSAFYILGDERKAG